MNLPNYLKNNNSTQAKTKEPILQKKEEIDTCTHACMRTNTCARTCAQTLASWTCTGRTWRGKKWVHYEQVSALKDSSAGRAVSKHVLKPSSGASWHTGHLLSKADRDTIVLHGILHANIPVHAPSYTCAHIPRPHTVTRSNRKMWEKAKSIWQFKKKTSKYISWICMFVWKHAHRCL